MSEINLLFVRHGQASASWENHLDPGLSEIGKDQAKNLTSNKKLPNLSNYDFLSSPKLRAIETSKPLAEKYKKEVVIDESFIEIPSSNIELKKKQEWLKNIIEMKKKDLPMFIQQWQKNIFLNISNIKKDTIIFTHFMVINSVVSDFVKADSIMHFFPDYTSITKVVLENGYIKDCKIGGNQKTDINL